MIRIKDNLKNYGKETELWYHKNQGEEFVLFMDTKGGYLVNREIEGESRPWLVKHKHASYIEETLPDDDMV